MGVTALGRHTRPACHLGSIRDVLIKKLREDWGWTRPSVRFVMGVTSLGRHTRPACTQGFTRLLKLCQVCRFNSCVRVFFIPWGHVSNHAHIWAFVTSISHMGQIRDSDWSRRNLLRSDWLLPRVAMYTTNVQHGFLSFLNNVELYHSTE